MNVQNAHELNGTPYIDLVSMNYKCWLFHSRSLFKRDGVNLGYRKQFGCYIKESGIAIAGRLGSFYEGKYRN